MQSLKALDSWPAGLLTIFETSRQDGTTLENRYYGPYDKLLNFAFGFDFSFFVAPQSPPQPGHRDTIDFVVFVVLDRNKRPVLIVEIKDDRWIEKPELRFQADIQIRERYSLMLNDCPLPCLWAISVLGTNMRTYCGNRDQMTITPAFINRPSANYLLPNDFLAGDWSVDILSQSGFEKVKEIVMYIVQESESVSRN